MKNKKYNEYLRQVHEVAPRLDGKSWWELDNVYNHYSEIRYSAFRMRCRLSTGGTSSFPKDGCEALWQGAEDLEIHFRKMMDERRDELNADRDCIVPISDCKLLQIQLEECGV